jgi:signal transduction histidine kinase
MPWMNAQTETQKQLVQEQLATVAAHLDTRHEAILMAWRAMGENDPDLSTGSLLSRTQFNDHIPDILDSFSRRLQAWPSPISTQVQQQEHKGMVAHGLHRWQQGFRLRELTREWGYLQLCIVEELEGYSQTHPHLEPMVIATALKALTHLCVAGVSDSADQYWQLHQDEAAGHVRDLEQALAALNTLESSRASGWHQAAHDLRGGLFKVSMASMILNAQNVPEPDRVQTIASLQKSVSLMDDMLNDLVDLARLDAGHEQRLVAPFDAAVLLSDFCLTMQPVADAQRLFLRWEGAESLPVEGDSAKVQRIVQNLVLNALKYTQHGGIVVMWESRKESDAEGWMVSVQDTGPGFHGDLGLPMANQLRKATQGAHDVEDQARTSGTSTNQDEVAVTRVSQSPHHSLHQQAGEGIGLSIVKGLCDLLDATLELETHSGQGSTFRVTFPSRYNS